MTRVIDFLVEILERIGRLFGIGRQPADPDDPFADPPKGVWRRLLGALPALILIFVLVYGGTLIWRFTQYHGMDMAYPQRVLPAQDAHANPPGAQPEGQGGGEQGTDAAGGAQAQATCAPSRIVEMQAALLDIMVNENGWVPGAPQYNLGFFGLVDFADTPWFDNKAAVQLGMLDMTRRVALDLADTLGRVRGTSEADPDLQAAQARLRTNPRAWVVNNPFDPQLQTVTQSAASSYRGAIPLYEKYNDRLASCDALFDARRDNLRTLLDRIAADVGSMASQLQSRSQAVSWSVAEKGFVEGEGNNYGWFDFRADNLFHQARGQLLALHGLMQAARRDFSRTIEQSDLGAVWDRMEAHLAEGARLNPTIVSNGREDGLMAPDHLSVMGEKVLRARANLVELRDILDR
jgi:hypothetical protein